LEEQRFLCKGAMMKITNTLSAALMLSPMLFSPALADVTLELIGSGEFTVGQAYPPSQTMPYPIGGESCLVWGRLTNVGTDVFEGIVLGSVGGSDGARLLSMLRGWELWDPSADPDDPLVRELHGYLGIVLDPGETFDIPIWEVWGVVVGGNPMYAPAPIGAKTQFRYFALKLLAGFDHEDPGAEAPDTFPVLDRGFTVTVTPEPATFCLLAVGAVVTCGRKRR
jgi:hypothetical protein